MRRHTTHQYQSRNDNGSRDLSQNEVGVPRIIACVLLGIAGVGLAASAANRQDDQKTLAKWDADYHEQASAAKNREKAGSEKSRSKEALQKIRSDTGQLASRPPAGVSEAPKK